MGVDQHERIELQVRGQRELFGARIALIQPELAANLQICLRDRVHFTVARVSSGPSIAIYGIPLGEWLGEEGRSVLFEQV